MKTRGDGGLRAKKRALLRVADEDAHKDETQDVRLLTRILPFARPHLFLFIVAFGLMPIVALASLVQPLLLKAAIDAAIVEASRQGVALVAGIYFVVIALEFVFRFTQTYLMQLAGQRSMADLRRTVFSHVQKLRLSYFDRTPVGRIATRMTNDVDSLGELFASGAVTALADFVTLFGIVCFMLYLDWRLALLSFASLPPLAILVEWFRKYARQAFRDIRAKIAELNAYLAEQVQGVAVVQAFGKEVACQNEFAEVNAAHRDANYRAVRFDALLYSVVESVSVACVAIVLWYAAQSANLLASPGAAAAYIGTVVAFYEYIHKFFIPIRDLSTKYTIIQASLASAERIFALLDVKEIDEEGGWSRSDKTRADHASVPDPSEGIRFDHVDFAYHAGHPVLRDVSFSVRKGETAALVGPTGSGKTTIASLLLRLYEMGAGRIDVAGRDITSLSRAELRRLFAVVPQDVFLFSGTVAENVALGEIHIDEARVEECLRRVGALDLVKRRPDGIRARVTERGGNFSAGERQLLAFARALYRDPPFVLLDEATANVDSETEARLQTALETVLRGRTCLVVAHRLSTVRKANLIVVLSHGQVLEQGNHETLLERNGLYAKLVALQLAAHTQETESAHPAAGQPVLSRPK